MSNIKKIYLFSISAPIGNGEVFLKNEIDYWLNEPGIELIVVPCEIPKSFSGEIPKYVDISLSETLSNCKTFKKSLLLKPRTWITCFIHVPLKNKLKPGAYRAVIETYTRQKLTVQWLSKKNIDTNTFFYSFWLLDSILAIAHHFKKTGSKAKVFSRAHRFDLYEYTQNYGFFPFRDRQIGSLKALFPASNEAVNYLKTHYGQKVPIILRKLGVRVGDHYQEKKPIQNQILRFVTCSYISPVKRVDLIASRLIGFANAHPTIQIEWAHFGDGEDKSKVLEVLQNKPTNFFFELKPFTPNDVLQKYYQNNWIDAFINLSLSEGQPVSIMEAMSNGIPCLATDVGGVNGIVIPNTTGTLIHVTHDQRLFNNSLYALIQNDKIDRSSIRQFIKENNSLEMQFKTIKESILGKHAK